VDIRECLADKPGFRNALANLEGSVSDLESNIKTLLKLTRSSLDHVKSTLVVSHQAQIELLILILFFSFQCGYGSRSLEGLVVKMRDRKLAWWRSNLCSGGGDGEETWDGIFDYHFAKPLITSLWFLRFFFSFFLFFF